MFKMLRWITTIKKFIPLRFALNSADCDSGLAVLNGDLFEDDGDKTADGKAEWENRYNAALSDYAAELSVLDSAPCCLTFSSEDATRSWHGRDGQPMPLWTAPSSAAAAVAMLESGMSRYWICVTSLVKSFLPCFQTSSITTSPSSTATS